VVDSRDTTESYGDIIYVQNVAQTRLTFFVVVLVKLSGVLSLIFTGVGRLL